MDFEDLVRALQVYVDRHVVPVWGTPCRLVRSAGFVKGAWAMVFLDDADDPDSVAYHDLTPDGLPEAKVFIKATLDDGDKVSVSASHELVEMLVDPAINLMTTGPDPKIIYAYEAADPVEGLSFPVRGIPMADFVYPAYFEAFHKRDSVPFDHLKRLRKPFQVVADGYQIVWKRGRWTQVYGSVAKKKRFAREKRRGHRSEQRAAGTLHRASMRDIARAERRL